MALELALPKEQEIEFKKYIYDLVKGEIESARRDTGLDKPFLKKVALSEWLGVSYQTVNNMIAEGLGCHLVSGVQLYSKQEAIDFIKQHNIN